MNTLHDSTSSANRVPPHSIEAEEQLLSACLIDGPDVVARCINAGVTPGSFHIRANRLIFTTLLDMISEGKEVSMNVLAEELKTARNFNEIGGYAYLSEISHRVPTTAGAAYFIAKVAELAALREAIRVATSLVESCYCYTGDGIAETIAPVTSRLLALTAGAIEEQEKAWDAVVAEAESDLTAMIEDHGRNARREIPFPWRRMNELFGPMQRGQLVVLAARASVGKSSLARPMMKAATDAGHRCFFITLEVNPRRVALQIASSIAGVGLREVAGAHPADRRDLTEALRSLKGRGITISLRDRSIARIEARARALHAKGALDILFIDHGGLVEDIYKQAKAGDKVGACGLLTKTLKRLATELNIVVVLLWQLNRASVQQGNREPNLTDLKDSGSLEEDADKVLLIHRPDVDPLSGSTQSESMSTADLPHYFQNVIQAKGRDDGTAFMSFYLRRATASFMPTTSGSHES